MKKLIIALLAITFSLGVACKKENVQSEKQKLFKVEKTMVEDNGGGGTVLPPSDGYPTGANVYPHNTGICYCGIYSVCHPAPQTKHVSGCDGTRPTPPGGDRDMVYPCLCSLR